MKILLWLDDWRDPKDFVTGYAPEYLNDPDNHKIIWIKDYDEFIHYISIHGLPNLIGFDHDLGLGLSGYDAAKWLIQYCMDLNKDLPAFFSQSANPVGRKDILTLLINYRQFRQSLRS